jgi:hypothetical protein
LRFSIAKTVKGEPIIHQVFANDLVIDVIKELERNTAVLRAERVLERVVFGQKPGHYCSHHHNVS